MMTKDELRKILTNNIVDVTFEKTDGTLREMRCTLMPEFLPAPPLESNVLTHSKRDENPNVIAVWDMNKTDWRSFRIDSLQSLDYLTE